MPLPSSKIFIFLLLLSLTAMVALSALGSIYEKEILARMSLEEAAKLAKTVFVFLGALFSISSITLFIRHFSSRAIKVAAIERPEYAKKLEQRFNPKFLNNITLIIIVVVILGSLYTAYEIQTGMF